MPLVLLSVQPGIPWAADGQISLSDLMQLTGRRLPASGGY